jgi:uncharacterized HAD superfamily protein
MRKRYIIDIDGVICTLVDNADYSKAEPLYDRIEEYNLLYEKNEVIYWTARGSTTGIDWTDVTIEQLNKWGVKYHDVWLGKPHYDVFICDKSINPNE